MYGAYQHRQGYEVADPAANRLVFERLRANYAHSIGGRAVERIRDMGAGLDGMPGQCADGSAPEPSLPWAKGELMISYYLEGGDEVTLRASGTEPKLKWYLEARRSTPEEAADAAEAEERDAATAVSLSVSTSNTSSSSMRLRVTTVLETFSRSKNSESESNSGATSLGACSTL